jgi:general secretion pathway protein K
MADAHRLVTARSTTPLTSLADASKLTGKAEALFTDTRHSVTSRYFEVSGQLQVGATTVQVTSVVQRDGMNIKTLTRQRGVVVAKAPLQ